MIKLIIATFLFYVLTTTLTAQWVQTNGPVGGIFTSLSVSGSGALFTGTEGSGVFRSTNDGINWSHTSLGNNEVVRSLAASGLKIFAGTYYHGVFLSLNDGLTWTQTALNNVTVRSLLISGQLVLAGTDQGGVLVSSNDGQTWQQTGLINAYAMIINNSVIFAATFSTGICFSTNNGLSWSQTSLSSGTFYSLAASGSNIFAGGANGVFRSTNNGLNWSQTALNSGSFYSLGIVGSNIFAGGYNVVYLSTNNGETWTQTTLNNVGGINSLFVKGANIFAGTTGSGIFVSDQSGNNWTQRNGGLYAQFIQDLIVKGPNVIAGGYDNIYISENSGQSWIQSSVYKPTTSFVESGTNVFAGCRPGIYTSSNNGLTWSVSGLNSSDVVCLAGGGSNIYAGTGSAVFISSDNGQTWVLSLNRYARLLAANGPVVIAYAYTGNFTYGVFTSINTQPWQQKPNPPFGPTAFEINGSQIFEGTVGHGIYISTDYAQSWIQTSLNNVTVYSLGIVGSNIFAGGYNVVYLSTNNGQTWTLKNEGIENLEVTSFGFASDYVYAGTVELSVWKRSTSELIGITPISNEIPKSFVLYQNYPNPFNPSTKIRFAVPPSPKGEGPGVRVVIYDILGKEVSTLVNEQLNPGTYEVEWDASDYPSGVYYYNLISGNYTDTKKMVLVK